MRVARWQLTSRLAAGPVIVQLVDGLRMAVTPGMTGATGNIYSGLHEFNDMAFVLHVMRPKEMFVDIGANVGAYSILAAATGAEVLAFEPVPETFRWLELNVRLNDLAGRVTTVRGALGSQRGSAWFTVNQGTVNHVAEAGDSGKLTEVAVFTLDEAVESACPSFIKMDVEGYESEVVVGGRRTLMNPGLFGVIMELNGSGDRYGFNEDALHQEMLSMGFATFSYDGWSRKLTPSKGQRNRVGNTLYLRDPVDAASRVASAPEFEVQRRLV